jgi:hypothetical protein
MTNAYPRRAVLAWGLAGCLPVAARGPTGPAGAASTANPGGTALVTQLLRITGLTLAPGQLRDAPGAVGSVWVADTKGAGAPVRWSSGSGFHSPVFGADGRVWALQEEALVRFNAPGQEPVRIQRVPGALKLVGMSKGDLIVLMADPLHPLAALPPAGGALRMLALDPRSDAVRQMLSRMRGQARGTQRFTVGPQRQSREGISRRIEWHDIILQPRDGSAPVNISRCDGVDCLQPALDERGERLAYIRVDG